MKIRNKITLLFTLLVAAILLVLSFSIYYLSAVESKEVFQKRLKSRASNNAQIFDYDTTRTVLKRIDGGTLAMLPQKSVMIFDTSANILYEYHAENAIMLVKDPARIQTVREQREDYFRVGKRDAIGLYYPELGGGIIIVVAAYDEDGIERLVQLRQVLLISLLIGMLITLITGYVFSSQLVKPISDITREVNTISSSNLSKRLPTKINQDELNQLARTFNDLLDRLQNSFMTQRRFISNASHELSTPLTSILSQLQVTFQNERTTDEYKRVLQSIQEDVEQMRQLTKSLLEIAKTGTQGTIELNELRVDELLLKVIADVKRSNPTYEVELQFHEMPEAEEQCRVFGNFDLLYSALKNIIENGCKYSPDRTSLVELNFSGLDIIIKVTNKGDIITEEEIEQIFQPFFRGNNAMDIKGFGLGLPLAKRIIALHKGEISVDSKEDKTTFIILLPSIAGIQPDF